MKYLLIPLLSGCAVDPYWTQQINPIEVKHIAHVDMPCGYLLGGKRLDGCWNASANTIEVRKGLNASREECVISHERKHAAGYVHEIREIVFAQDCGDGRVM